MKKILILTLALLIGLTPVHAAGKIAGVIYGTDIVTYVYNSPITSYNIGGVTCIDAEILNWHYGFDVYWFEDTRRLEITDKGGRFVSGQTLSGELIDEESCIPGEIAGYYYSTDIVTTLNGRGIESYNIGGRTMIVAEAMRDFGYSVIWDESARTLKIDKPMDFYKYDTEYGVIKSMNNYDSYVNFAIETEAKILLVKNGERFMIETPVSAFTDHTTTQCISFSDFAEIFGGQWSFSETVAEHENMWATGQYSAYEYELEFTYDASKQISVSAYDGVSSGKEWPNKTDAVDVVMFTDISTINVNGEAKELVAQNGGKTFPGNIIMHDGKLYIPVQMAAELLGYDIAALEIV